MKAKSEQMKRRNGEEASLDSVLSADGLSKRTLLDVLSELSIDLPRPKKLKDRELTAKLWQVIHALLGQSIVLVIRIISPIASYIRFYGARYCISHSSYHRTTRFTSI